MSKCYPFSSLFFKKFDFIPNSKIPILKSKILNPKSQSKIPNLKSAILKSPIQNPQSKIHYSTFAR